MVSSPDGVLVVGTDMEGNVYCYKSAKSGLTLICTVQYLRYDEMRKGTIGLRYEIFEDKMGMDKHLLVVEFQDGFAIWDVTALYGYLYVVGRRKRL